MHNVSVFDREGNFIRRFGEFGSEPGQLNRPAGLVVDSEDNLIVTSVFFLILLMAPKSSQEHT